MAKSGAVWAIDVGNCSLKALRCRSGETRGSVVAEAFDYIEYPKILTQPGAEAVELVNDAIQQFLSRNSVRGDTVAISVSGQNGLARFIKLPPVEAKKIPDIVRYEARQQIPFDLNDVIWDYQRMGGAGEEGGFVLETEIGLFAMKRDQVFRALEPFDRAAIEVDCVQLTPLAIYNFMAFDQLGDLPPPDEYDPDNPPPSVVVLSMGTDASDLVITNGFRVWQRSVPLGGSHFTKALTKELKLTFAKAEHLKRNAATAEDPKAVFQAMRPVFNDLLTEIQRSIGYFTSIDRAAKIERIVALGNPVKLPGLRRYLSQGLNLEVTRLESFQKLTGPEVLNAPAFQENQLCFAVCYGLALQGLREAALRTNLLPKEIVKDRLIGAKKPWAVAAAAVLLLGCTLSLASLASALGTVDPAKFKQAEAQANAVVTQARGYKDKAQQELDGLGKTETIGRHVVENVEGRLRWLELLKAVGACLPSDPPGRQPPEDISLRNLVYIDGLDCQWVESFGPWFGLMRQWNWLAPEERAAYGLPASDPLPEGMGAGGMGGSMGGGTPTAGGTPSSGGTPATGGSPGATTTDASAESASTSEGPQGSGWLVEIRGHHYHNPNRPGFAIGPQYVQKTIMNSLRTGRVPLPTGKGEVVYVPLNDLGVCCPVLVNPQMPYKEIIADPNAGPLGGPEGGSPGVRQPRTMGSPPGYGYPGGSSATGSGRMPMPSSSMPGPGMGGPSSAYSSGPRSYPGPRPPMSSPPGTGTYAPGAEVGNVIELQRFDFVIQFAWQPVPRSEWVARVGQGARPVAPPVAPGGTGAVNPEGPAAGPPPKVAPMPKTAPGPSPAPEPSPPVAPPAAPPANPSEPTAPQP